MKTWQRAGLDRFCGNCHGRIKKDAVYCLWKIPGVKSEKLRCVECAGEPAPANVPALTSLTKPEPVPAMRRLGLLPLDELSGPALSGGREPGMEG